LFVRTKEHSGLQLYLVAELENDNLIMKIGIELIAEERQRQIEKEGWKF